MNLLFQLLTWKITDLCRHRREESEAAKTVVYLFCGHFNNNMLDISSLGLGYTILTSLEQGAR